MAPPSTLLNFARLSSRLVLAILLGSTWAYGGGPRFVAGVTGFDPAVAGKPILWANGVVNYYTDQGDLSSLLPQASANAFVADAFSRWTSVSTAALVATRVGSLAEDVNGSNVVATQSGVSLPADVLPSSGLPFAVVYDFDGRVTDTLLGTGASDPSLCSTNSVLGGADLLSADGHIGHALLIINGLCAQNTSDLAPLKYELIRAIGRALGLGWSQANDNVVTLSPFPTTSDFAGFPLMHPLEPFCIGAITTCIPNADQLRMDDRAAISRLYPVTMQNVASFPGKQVFADNTVRIHGVIYFPDVHGKAGQPMQGVNVVARLIDPDTGLPSRIAVISCVSGFLFRGNAGNPVSGYGGAQRFDHFGGGDPSLEGFFDLAGLELPAGHTSASFQLTLEAINPLYRDEATVGPYADGMVSPSGARQTILLATLAAGMDAQQDIVMAKAPASQPQDQPAIVRRPVPLTGDWWGTLAGYGRTEIYRAFARTGRTVALQLTSMNESLRPTTNKLQPEIGLWLGSDPSTSLPQSRGDSFNGPTTGTTLLNAPVTSTGPMQIGIADYRGDGRPDFIYHAHLLYADSVSPARIAAAGTILQLKGIGFRQGMAVIIGTSAATILGIDANNIYVQSPGLSSGAQDITVQDAISGMSSTMTSALTYGIVATDQITLVSVANPTVAMGTTAPIAVRFRATAVDGTALPHIPVSISVTPAASLMNACGGNACTLTSDANGEVSSFVTVNGSGANVVTASISNGHQAQTTIAGSSALILSAVTPQLRVPNGNSATVTLAVRLMNSGSPVSGRQINYSIMSGNGSLGSASAVTDMNGAAAVNLTFNDLTATVTVNACTSGTACAQFSILPVAPGAMVLQKLNGDGQLIPIGQSLQPIVLRVVDSASPPNPVTGVSVTLSGAAFAPAAADCVPDTGICRPMIPHPWATFIVTLASDANGLISYTPTVQPNWGAVQVGILASAGTSASQNFNLQVFAPAP